MSATVPGAWEAGREHRRVCVLGPWQLELRDDELAELTHRGRRVLRGVQAVLRDPDWNTIDWTVDGIELGDQELSISLRVDQAARADAELRVRASDDRLLVDFGLRARQTFWTNRVGLVVLHPPELSGTPLAVDHTKGSQELTAFPSAISPHQPALDITGLTWRAGAGRVRLEFSGDIFEMEDQRNWTDASFKTYNRPPAAPFPYRIEAGEQVRQRLVIQVSEPPPDNDGPVRIEPEPITLSELTDQAPAIAVAASTAADPAPGGEPVSGILLSELIVGAPNSPAALRRAMATGCELDLRVVIGSETVSELTELLNPLNPARVVRIGAFDAHTHLSTDSAVTLLRTALDRLGLSSIPVIGGARSHFTELYRGQDRLPQQLAGIGFSITPMFHSRSTVQLVESLPIQRLVAEQARGIAAGRPLHIGPITLRPRFNNVATTQAGVRTGSDLSSGYGPSQPVDDRQDSPELAAWTIASAAALAVPTVESLTYFEDWGPQGVRDHRGDRPVAAALRRLGTLRGSLSGGHSSDHLVWVLADRRRLLVANLDQVPRRVVLSDRSTRIPLRLAPGQWCEHQRG
ncbi:hypothetical protein ACF3NT_09770 [Naumannella halotolerans]|uniref:hypothetical protein n=1 Tax=Naumannella halotolerans TaxID=993414 RepID=UPI00370D02AA